jgi:hypothetical protein
MSRAFSRMLSNRVNNMTKYAREQFFLSANELVDSFQRNNSKSYWSLIPQIMKGTSGNIDSSLVARGAVPGPHVTPVVFLINPVICE